MLLICTRYTYIHHFLFFFGHISSCSHLCPKRRMRWAQFDRWGLVAGGLGVIRAVCRAWQAFFYLFGPLAHLRHPRVSATSPGIGFLYPLSSCTHVRFGCKPGFSASRRVHVHFPIFAQSSTLRSCRPAAVKPPSSSVQLYARVAAVVVGDCFDRSLRCFTRLYAITSRCCRYCCFCQVSSDMPA